MGTSQMRFQGKSVLVTGGATGVGYATALRFASEGAGVIITGRRIDAGQEAEQRLTDLGYRARFLSCDVSDEAGVKRLFDSAIAMQGRIDVLVNNAASFQPIRFIDANYAEWRKVSTLS